MELLNRTLQEQVRTQQKDRGDAEARLGAEQNAITALEMDVADLQRQLRQRAHVRHLSRVRHAQGWPQECAERAVRANSGRSPPWYETAQNRGIDVDARND